MDVVSAILGPILLVLGLSGVLTGTFRVVRHRTTEGVSMVSTLLQMLANISWIAYGVVHAVPLQIFNNAPMAMLALVVMVIGWKSGNLARPLAFIGALLAYALFATFFVLTIGLLALSVILTILSVVNRMPQMWESWKHPGGEGLSVASLLLTLGASTGWMFYGLIHAEGAVIATSIYGMFSVGFILLRTVQARRNAHRAARIAVTPALRAA